MSGITSTKHIGISMIDVMATSMKILPADSEGCWITMFVMFCHFTYFLAPLTWSDFNQM